MIKKVLFLSDIHLKPISSSNRILNAIEKFMPDFAPDILVYLGDTLDCEELLGFNSKPPFSIQWDFIREEIKNANDMLNRHIALCRPNEKHFWFGNHEERFFKFKQLYPSMAHIVPDIDKELKLKKRGFITHRQNELYPFGKLYAMHGNAYGLNHTKKNLLDYEVSLIYGHVHSHQIYTKISSYKKSPKSAISIGCAS